jgi:hypothetical protein
MRAERILIENFPIDEKLQNSLTTVPSAGIHLLSIPFDRLKRQFFAVCFPFDPTLEGWLYGINTRCRSGTFNFQAWPSSRPMDIDKRHVIAFNRLLASMLSWIVRSNAIEESNLPRETRERNLHLQSREVWNYSDQLPAEVMPGK